MKVLELDRPSETVKGTLFLSKEEDISPHIHGSWAKFELMSIDFASCPQSFAWFSHWAKYCKQFLKNCLSWRKLNVNNSIGELCVSPPGFTGHYPLGQSSFIYIPAHSPPSNPCWRILKGISSIIHFSINLNNKDSLFFFFKYQHNAITMPQK